MPIRGTARALQTAFEEASNAGKLLPTKLASRCQPKLRATYHDAIVTFEADPGPAETLRFLRKFHSRLLNEEWPLAKERVDDRSGLEQWFGPTADMILSSHALTVDRDSRDRLLVEICRAVNDGLERLVRHAEGDYASDPKADRFPDISVVAEKTSTLSAPPAPRPSISLKQLLADWWTEAQALGRTKSTYEAYGNVVRKLTAFVGHDDAARITSEDILRYKSHRMQQVSAKTVKDSDLAGLKAVLGWGVANKRLAANPAASVTVKGVKPVKLREKGFDDAEAKAILKATYTYQPTKREPAKKVAAKRWAPWIMAYTGARVGEIVQLRKEDVRHDESGWFIIITPDAGPVKDKEARRIPLHSHLVELGFIEFVRASPDGYLFLTPNTKGDVMPNWRSIKMRVAEFVRSVVEDPAVRPNHGWRHRFLTIGSEVGAQDRVLYAITGHAPVGVGGAYGNATLKAMRRAIEMLPRYEVGN